MKINLGQQTLGEVKAKVEAFELLFGKAPRIFVQGTLRDKVSNDLIFALGSELEVISLSKQSMTLDLGEEAAHAIPEIGCTYRLVGGEA